MQQHLHPASEGEPVRSSPLEHDERDAILKLQQRDVAQIFVNERQRSFLIPATIPGRADKATGISRVVERIGEAPLIWASRFMLTCCGIRAGTG
ncbi:MAG: hypothetical protein KME13_18060 [Myxacorys californica WJT36-NPBG1]|nr:hypothetical protein [Myxacorys californica WJT36-NPBG1]